MSRLRQSNVYFYVKIKKKFFYQKMFRFFTIYVLLPILFSNKFKNTYRLILHTHKRIKNNKIIHRFYSYKLYLQIKQIIIEMNFQSHVPTGK